MTKLSKVSPENWRLRSNLTAAMIRFFLASTCASLYSLYSFEYIFFADILRGFSRPYLNSLPVEGQINFSAFVANKAHEVAYFLLLHVFVGGPAGGKFTVLIKSLPFLAQICRCPIHIRPVVRWISVSFRHVYPVCVVFVVRNPTTSTPCYVFTTCTPCWITSRLAWFNVIG